MYKRQILNFFGEDERILATLEKDTTKNQDEGLLEVYRKLRPGEPPTVESATSQINMLFFDPRRYDLSRFGRYKMCIRDRPYAEQSSASWGSWYGLQCRHHASGGCSDQSTASSESCSSSAEQEKRSS